jgi:outer membrane protein
MKKNFVIAFIMVLHAVGVAQSTTLLTLDHCIATALKNNTDVQREQLRQEVTGVALKQSKMNRLPQLNAAVAHGINQGRSIDPFTNTYIDEQVNYANYGLSSNLLLFNGFSVQHSIRQNHLAQEASKLEVKQVRENITLNVMLAYLQVLNAEDIVAAAEKQVAVTTQQIERLEVLHEQGAIAPSLLYDLRGQLANEKVSLISNRNAVVSAKLQLQQLMNVPYHPDIELQRIEVRDQISASIAQPAAVYERALQHLSGVKAAALRRASAEAAIRSIRGELYPSLFLVGNLNSNYSSAARMDIFVNTTDEATSDYVMVNGTASPVITQKRNFITDRITYGAQIKNNTFSNVGITLRIPIFNNLQVRNRVALAKIELASTTLEETNQKLLLQQQVELAVVTAKNAWERLQVLQDQLAAYTESFRAAEIRFNAGVGTVVDYLLAKNNLDRANISLVSARYDLALRNMVLGYYTGERR